MKDRHAGMARPSAALLPAERSRLTRRTFFGLCAATAFAGMLPAGAHAQAAAQAASSGASLDQAIADHFSATKTMQGEFVQFGPRGEQTSGRFFIERPGKMRFNYDSPSPMRVIADGSNVIVGNVQMKTWDVYPLSKTPLTLLLADKIDLSADMVRSVKEEAEVTTIVLGNRTIFGDALITMIFDSKTYDLRQWTVTDNQGKDTSVVINNVKTNIAFDESVFRIPYNDLNARQR